MRYTIDEDLLRQARAALSGRERLVWVVGASASGKTTICQALAARFAAPLVDMDAHIYGDYHGRFTRERHPANTAWSASPNGLAWLLDMTWEEFDSFNRAALPEYLDLLAEDLAATPRGSLLIVDGGVCNPALLAQAIPARQIVCLAAPGRDSVQIWERIDARKAMKDEVCKLPYPEDAWRKFLEFDDRIAATMLNECRQCGIPVCLREEATTGRGAGRAGRARVRA